MKYMLLIYNNRANIDALSQDERAAIFGNVDRVVRELTESGELIDGEGLADESNTRTVRVREGVPAITDGPFAEAKEQLIGYFIVDCETLERATEIAAQWPDAQLGAIEVRPLMVEAGTEM